MLNPMPLNEAQSLPFWRRPVTLLFVMAMTMPIAFNAWSALLNNFVIEVANFDGADIGLLHTVREIPGFLAIGVIAVIIFIREQVLAMISLMMLGVATAVTAWFPSLGGLLFVTLFSSIGFHYYETVNQSLQLQWLPKDRAPQILGWLVAMGSAATAVVYGLIVLTWERFDLSYNFVFMAAGGVTVLLALFSLIAYPQFDAPTPQTKKLILRRRYWLYYALQFMAGARRQIFIVFAGFMMVEKFGFKVHELTSLYLINLMINMMAAPLLGKAVAKFGERRTLIFEYAGLAIVFAAYGGIYWFGWGVLLAAILYVIDHVLFALALALKTYFQKIADPADIAPTAAVAFTINHIAAVFLPALLGLLWVVSPGAVFGLAAAMAIVSLLLSLLIPRHPEPGNETTLTKYAPAPAE
ncbi:MULTISPECIES: MFS transporter [unclassified Ruegeria]|uniref:MFS transporter n=1 Tax=unclassified Ruegeria TaxID=2625375 RepID=UPI001488E278|nr:MULTISPECIES: MFS transporter [unclassified Ruegeria]NOD77131.1 MFS transporter [Ruegeria sp. HKCCD4332]NOD89602.1 MFS transporter [Ruegeria sp. HKCCD4318]NOD93036.1 MFS transporter [Ruegeria sp. HKCCD4884]NOE13925.1 MFS transporter [Ruegeria sp. HKCCD4318-2]NOG08138.1 MFS transporter [Ruegeria sp. HKCCD4315]